MSTKARRHARLVALNRALRRFERRLEDVCAAALRKLSWHVAEHYVPGSDASFDEWLFEFEITIQRQMHRHLLTTANAFGDETLLHFDRILSTKTVRDQLHAVLEEWINTYSFAKTRTITELIREEARKALAVSVSKGESSSQLAKRLARVIGGKRVKWALIRMARTEVHAASEKGSFEAARSSGLIVVKEWAALEDRRTRLSHAIADGQLRELDVVFSVGADHLMFPGDPNGSGKETINCRCVALYHPRINGELIR